MDIQQLRFFVMICRMQSFSKAAEKCFISAQGISMSIRRLEEYLSCSLFERSPKGIALTKHARYLLPTAQKIVELADNCEDYFAALQDAGQRLSVIFTRGIITEFADAPIAEFCRKHPKVFFEKLYGCDIDCEVALDNYEVELALTAGPLDPAKYIAEFIYSRRYGIVVHYSDPLAKREFVGIRDLDGRPLSIMHERQKTYSVIKSAADASAVTLDIREWVDDALLTYQYADMQRTTGITTGALMPYFERMNLKFIPFEDPALSWDVYLAMRQDHTLSHVANTFAQAVRQHRDNMLEVEN